MKRKQWSQRLRHVVLMCAAAIGLTAFGDDYFGSGTPAVTWGADFTNAVVTATVTDGYADVAYTLTYGLTEVTGTVADGTVTFNVPVAENARYADFNYSIAAKVNNASVGETSGKAIVADKKAWFSTTASATTNGAWNPQPTVDGSKMTFTESNTFTPNAASSSKIVVLNMGNVCFGDTNDAEISDAQAGIRIGESGKFEVLTTNNAWQVTSVVANGGAEYDVVVTINYGTKKYSVKVGESTISNIDLAGDKTKVESIEFQGDGSLGSLTGEYYDGAMVKDSKDNTYDTVADAITAYVADSSIAPLTMLHTGTAPAGWTIEKGVLAQATIEVEEEETTATEVTTIVAVPYSTTTLTAATLINMSNRTKVTETLVLKVYDKTTKDYNSWTYENGAWVANNVAKAGAGSEGLKTSKPATEVELAPGDGVWVTYNPQAPLILNGTYATGSVQKTLEVGYNLIAPLPREGQTVVDLNSEAIFTAPANDGDRIIIQTSGAPYNCQYKAGKWQTLEVYKTDSGRASTRWVDAPKVKSGTGFWYYSPNGATINL